MTDGELTRLVMRLGTAADVVEAVDDPELQRQRGWDLSKWRYDLIPWGVRFSQRDPQRHGNTALLVLLDVYSANRSRFVVLARWGSGEVVLMLG